MTPSLLLRFKRLGVKLCRERGIDERTVDFESIYDCGISYYENKHILILRINSLACQISKTKMKEMIDRYNDYISEPMNNPNSLYRFLEVEKK